MNQGVSGAKAPLIPHNVDVRAAFLLLVLLPACVLGEVRIERESTVDPRGNQKAERIRIEDAGNRIDELRVGGQSRRIVVQPKTNVPPYEMPTEDMARTRAEEPRKSVTGRKQRTWKVLDF